MPLDEPGRLLAENSSSAGGSAATTALRDRVAALNDQMRHHGATDVLRLALRAVPNLALVSSFGAESVALLHLAAMVNRDLPVLFIDTQMLFAETLVYQQELAERLGLRRVHILRAADIADQDPAGTLHQRDPDACCALRKSAPLDAALADFDGWITGRKRFQSGTRAALEFFEVEDGTGRIKVNPLARWAPQDVQAYMTENRLPRHPLVAQGYPSIGCAPCTSPVAPGEDARAGRWRDQSKEECGIHFVNGKMVRTGADS
ncbi:phosphoadenylyl-sulfate reductase [Sulfitobacter sabulilitoris]|uniref:Adenosine 5'-phosphosulfate reductase n=1 Tax=Sulfitobacter sabulilitoris TaxID=2562655 RepID=A0A5S3PJ50_9RHOB|nr:phosphoadenylyl-sulfate reductase [Sulfitobacter sabulilitoris]TMM54367.1 phosphoadenylyl-sulfate reductase [Sulfitobacter sabulilitoris]